MPPGTILVRSSALFALGFALIVASYFAPEKKSWVKEWAFPLAGAAGVFASYVAAAALGATAARMVLADHFREGFGGRSAASAVMAAGAVAAVYMFVIVTQFVANADRWRRGQSIKPIEWYRGQKARKRGSRAKKQTGL